MASIDGSTNLQPRGYQSFDQWMRPAQAKWFKKGQDMSNPQAAYEAWLNMLRQREMQPNVIVGQQPTPNVANEPPIGGPPGGGRGRGGGRGGSQSAAGPGAGNKPWQNPNRPAGANDSFRPTGKPGIPQGGGAPPPSNPFAPAGQQPQQQWGNKDGGPGAEQAGNPLAFLSYILRNYRGGGGPMGNKG